MADYVKLKKDNDDKPPRRVIRKRTINFKFVILLIIFIFLLSSIISSIMYGLTPKIAVVPITGVISTQSETTLYGSAISSRYIADILRDLEDDTSVKAVLLDINSPGGSPVASQEISNAIESLREVKPVYALVNDVGASGAFWIAVSADKIYASKFSTLGSIGVTSAGLGFEDFIRDWNITYRRQVAGEYKDMGTPFRAPTENEEEMLDEILEEIHEDFILHVATSRNLSVDEVKPYAQGQIFLGDKAESLGFIDEIGYYPNAIEDLREVSNSPSAIIVEYGPEPSFAEALGLDSVFSVPSTKSQILLK